MLPGSSKMVPKWSWMRSPRRLGAEILTKTAQNPLGFGFVARFSSQNCPQDLSNGSENRSKIQTKAAGGRQNATANRRRRQKERAKGRRVAGQLPRQRANARRTRFFNTRRRTKRGGGSTEFPFRMILLSARVFIVLLLLILIIGFL